MARYKLPKAGFGGAEIDATYRGLDGGRHWYTGTIEGVGGFRIGLANPLEEVRPPSIDDPAPWPLVITERGGNGESIRLRGYDGTQPGVVAVLDAEDMRTEVLLLTADDLLHLAQAAYQKWRQATDPAVRGRCEGGC